MWSASVGSTSGTSPSGMCAFGVSRNPMKRILTIALGAFKESVRERVLYNLVVFGFLMAIFIGIGLVSKEIECRTIYNILSKPVRRYEFILGKFAGLLITLFVNTAIMTAGFYIALAFQKGGLGPHDMRLLVAVYFILLQLAIAVGIAIFFSCISTPVLSAVFTFALIGIGN